MRTTVSSKGQIVLPADLRKQDEIVPGDAFDVERIDRGEYRLVRRGPPDNAGVVSWLRRCPEQDWFVAVEGDSTDAL